MWFFYWAEILNTLKIILLSVGGVGFVFMGFWNLVSWGDDRIKPKWIIACVVAIVIGAFFPSKKTVYIMAGIDFVEEVVNNEEVQNISNNTLEVINLYLEKTKSELEKEE